MNHKILIVDDEPANIRMLERLFRSEFDVVTAESGSDGLELLTVHDISLIVTDQRMPGMTGLEFLKKSADLRPQCVRIILTGYTDINDLVDALNSGLVYKYVTKPWVNADLLQTVKRGLSHHETIKAQHRLNIENQRLRNRISSADEMFLKLYGEMLRVKDPDSVLHAARTRDLAIEIGRALNFERTELERLAVAAYIHGIAEFQMPNGSGRTDRAITDDERRLMEEQRENGLMLISGVPELDEIATIVRYHTEHFDGSGTSYGLAGSQIPLYSRIVAVARAFSDMTLHSHSDGSSSERAAISVLKAASGTRFDPDVVNVFCGLKSVSQIRESIPVGQLVHG